MAQTVKIDITPGWATQFIRASQNDVGRSIKFYITDGNGFFDLSGMTAKLVGTKPSELGFTVNGTINGQSVEIVTTEEMTDEYGNIPCELRITDANDLVVGTANMILSVEPNPHPDGTVDGKTDQFISEITLLVERAEAASEAIQDMGVTAQSGAAGTEAVVVKDVDPDTGAVTLEFTIPRGNQGNPGATGNGIASAVLNADYTLTLTFTDGTSYTTPSIRGASGVDGKGIASIAKTGTSGLVDTYTITYTDGTTTTFTVTNGRDGTDGQNGQDGSDGYSPIATVSKSGDVVTITITDKNGTTSATVDSIPSGGIAGQVLGLDSNLVPTWVNQSGGGTYSLIVTASTQDGVTVTGQTVTVRANDASGQIFAEKPYNGQPVSFALPVGFVYYVSISDNLPAHFNPTTDTGIIVDADIAVALTYSDFSSISTLQDVKAALEAGLDLSPLVGLKPVFNVVSGNTLAWDIANYDSTNKEVTCVLHDTLPDQRQFDPPQALGWFENGLAAGNYYFKHSNTDYYLTLASAIPSGGQLRATTSAFQTYASPSDSTTIETGTISTTPIAGAVSLGTTASDSGTYALNHMDRVNYGSNNYAESGLLEWLNSDDASGVVIIGKTKFSRPYLTNVAGFLYGWSAADLACIEDSVWKCSANNAYECPASMGGLTVKSNPYTVTKKIGLLSEMEVFGSYGGVADGSSLLGLYNGADAADRIKYYNDSARIWWLRSPHWYVAHTERRVNTSGSADSYSANLSHGAVPALKIKKSA